jgi:hypothetical protein
MADINLNDNRKSIQATSDAEIQPLLAMCRDGRLFDVQAWIAAGKPVNVRRRTSKSTRQLSPLILAINGGFNSLVDVLLGAGADPTNMGRNRAMNQAVKRKRPDIVQLLVDHGADPAAVSMKDVFGTEEEALIRYFIDRGANLKSGRPLARALCHYSRVALNIYRQYRKKMPYLKDQLNLALRYHCENENLYWMGVLLRTGADPYAEGPSHYGNVRRGGQCAIAIALLNGNEDEVFRMPGIRLDARRPEMNNVAKAICLEGQTYVLKKLIDAGLVLNDDNGGCSLLRHAFSVLESESQRDPWRSKERGRLGTGGNSHETRKSFEIIELLAQNGACWIPKDSGEIGALRSALCGLRAAYTFHFVCIICDYRACLTASLRELLSTPRIRTHTERYRSRIASRLEACEEARPPLPPEVCCPSHRLGG